MGLEASTVMQRSERPGRGRSEISDQDAGKTRKKKMLPMQMYDFLDCESWEAFIWVALAWKERGIDIWINRDGGGEPRQ